VGIPFEDRGETVFILSATTTSTTKPSLHSTPPKFTSKSKIPKEINPTQYQQPHTYLVINLKINLTHTPPFRANIALYRSQQLVHTAKFRQTKLHKVGGIYSFLSSAHCLPTSGSSFGSFTNDCTRFVCFDEETEVGGGGVFWCIRIFDETCST